MKQTERIMQMEQRLDRASQAVAQLTTALNQYEAVQDDIHQLSQYYDSDAWKHDFAADEAGLLPHDLKRGVLSEDAIWNLLTDIRELEERISPLLTPPSPHSPIATISQLPPTGEMHMPESNDKS